MEDITDRTDIVRMVDEFYGQIRTNSLLGPLFDEVARVDWEKHLPKLYSFWASILLDEHSYTGNPMLPHLTLSRRSPLGAREFDEWIRLFTTTVDRLFAGPRAEEAKQRAANIARLMLYKVQTNR
jgi:hemoglobin